VNNVIKNRQFRSCVINLERNQEKLSEFKNNYKLPIKLEVFKAVDAKKLSMKHLHKHGVVGDYGMECILRGDKYYHHELTPGAVGCYLSHVHLWKKMVDEKISCMIIFEDDAIVNNVDLMELNMRLNELPKNWHMYMIGNPHSIVEVNQINSEGLDKMSRFCGLHAYVLNYEGAKYLLENGKLFPMNQQIDMHVSELAQEHGFNIYFHQNKSLINMSSEGSSDVQIIPLRELSWERLRV
jgi:glycosyl transferase family 25